MNLDIAENLSKAKKLAHTGESFAEHAKSIRDNFNDGTRPEVPRSAPVIPLYGAELKQLHTSVADQTLVAETRAVVIGDQEVFGPIRAFEDSLSSNVVQLRNQLLGEAA